MSDMYHLLLLNSFELDLFIWSVDPFGPQELWHRSSFFLVDRHEWLLNLALALLGSILFAHEPRFCYIQFNLVCCCSYL